MDFLEKYDIDLKDKNLLLTSLTHSSYANEHGVTSYERLEFLGDSVLQLIVSEYLYENFDLKEGAMSKMRASFVCEEALASYAKEIGYIPYVRVGHGQLHDINNTIIADIFEAILGCVYLECGFEVAKNYIYKTVIPHINKHEIYLTDYKSALQEATQMNKHTLDYVLTKELGPAHNKTYQMEVRIDNIVYGTGIGKTKKEAEQMAAKDALSKKASNK